jgi:hypothetical protein
MASLGQFDDAPGAADLWLSAKCFFDSGLNNGFKLGLPIPLAVDALSTHRRTCTSLKPRSLLTHPCVGLYKLTEIIEEGC